MLKTFIVGILLGVAGAAAALYTVPVIDQHREASIVSVAANGTNIESFHVNVPMDRILVGAHGQPLSLPEGLSWPSDPVFEDIRAELFKVRNARDAVVGIAARTAARQENGPVIDWVVHLPARGSMFVSLQAEADSTGFRSGELLGGSREFSGLIGTMMERWIANPSAGEDEPAGRIELTTAYVRKQEAP